MTRWLVAFVLTQLIEAPIYLRAMRGRAMRPEGWRRAALVALGASALTHPIVWFLFPRLSLPDYWTMVGAAESFAVVAEALWLRAFGARSPWLWAVLANGASLAIGLLCRAMFGYP